MSAAFQRQIRPIYDALDTGSNKSAIVACNKVLKKHPQSELVKALKALALVRLQKVDESVVLCDEVLASKSTDDATLSAMMHVLRGLGRHNDLVTMFDHAYKQQPNSEELGAQTFFALIRIGNWKFAQQVSTKMYKQFQDERYLYWSIMCSILQANDPATPENIRNLLYNLAHRLVTSSPTPSYFSADRLFLHLTILRELRLFDDAYKLLSSDVGNYICSTSLVCNEIRREIWRSRGMFEDEAKSAREKIIEKQDRNWLEFLSVLDATFFGITEPQNEGACDVDEAKSKEYVDRIAETRVFLSQLAADDGNKERSALLALLELEKRARSYDLSTDARLMVTLMEQYIDKLGDKACCFEDLKPYLQLGCEDISRWTTFLGSFVPFSTSLADLQRTINVHKLVRYSLQEDQLNPTLESPRAAQYLKEYLSGLHLGAGLPETELQPADDLIILAANAFVNLWHLAKDETYLYQATVVLEFGLAKSNQSFWMRLLLIRIYRLLGAPSLALDHFRMLNLKQIQNDTLSHFVLSRATTFSLAATGDLTYPSECLESSQIYLSNSQETPDYVIRAFTGEKYSQIPEFIAFEDRLDNSLQRDLIKVEHVRMRLTHEPITAELIDMELIELKFIFDRYHHDNRDFEIIPNYQPRCQPSFDQQTRLFQKDAGQGWLWAFLKVYIRVFQQASDLDENAEDKILVGDRPQQSRDLPKLKERLVSRRDEELENLTPDELSLLDLVAALTDWLEPYHNHIRPPHVAVLADATKQVESKSGQHTKIPDPAAHHGANGHGKKEDDSPPFREPPPLVSNFFQEMQQRFKKTRSEGSVSDLLHVATITQEAFILFVIETVRFKPPSVAKVHRLGLLVQSVKDIRCKGLAVLRNMAAELQEMSETEASPDSRRRFVAACEPFSSQPEIDQAFISGVARKTMDARKKVLEGIGKGITRLCATHAS